MQNEIISLSGRELGIMKLLWKSEISMGASEIAQAGAFSINTVQAVLKSLLKKEYIEVGDIGYSGTVLSRKYVPVLTADAYIKDHLLKYSNLKLTMGIFSSLIEDEIDTEIIDKLEKMLKKRKTELNMK